MSSYVHRVVREALIHAERQCRYHRDQFDFLGTYHDGTPRCESCQQPWRVRRALDAIDQALATPAPTQSSEGGA